MQKTPPKQEQKKKHQMTYSEKVILIPVVSGVFIKKIKQNKPNIFS